MATVTLHTLKLQTTLAERAHAVVASKARSGSLAAATRRKYLAKMPQTQNAMIQARSKLSNFIASQKMARKF